MRNQRETVLIEAPGNNEPGYDPEDGAVDVTLRNLEEEIRDTEGLSVTVNKIIGGPNKPMGHCFKQMASNFPMLDDLKEYVQKHYGEGDYRAFYRVGNKIKYNIPFSVSKDLGPKAPDVPATHDSELRAVLDFVRESNEATNRRFEQLMQQITQGQTQVNPIQQIRETLELVKPLLPAPAPAGEGGISGLREFLELRAMMKDELGSGGAPEENMLTTVIKEAIPAFKELATNIIAARSLRVPGAAPNPTALPPPTVSDSMTPEEKALFGVLQAYTPHLQQIDQLATLKADPTSTADSVLDQVPEAAYPTLASVAAPPMRAQALTVIAALVPGSAPRRDWWSQFLDAVHQALLPADGEA